MEAVVYFFKIGMEYSSLVEGNSWPFLVVSVELTLILIEVLHVMNEPGIFSILSCVIYLNCTFLVMLYVALIMLDGSTIV